MIEQYITVTLILLLETERARKFRRKDFSELWLPRSQIKSMTKLPGPAGVPPVCVLEIPEWLAQEKGLA